MHPGVGCVTISLVIHRARFPAALQKGGCGGLFYFTGLFYRTAALRGFEGPPVRAQTGSAGLSASVRRNRDRDSPSFSIAIVAGVIPPPPRHPLPITRQGGTRPPALFRLLRRLLRPLGRRIHCAQFRQPQHLSRAGFRWRLAVPPLQQVNGGTADHFQHIVRAPARPAVPAARQ